MPKTLATQGFSGLREDVVRPEGCPSRSPVQQALILHFVYPGTFPQGKVLFLSDRMRSVQKAPASDFEAGAGSFFEGLRKIRQKKGVIGYDGLQPGG